jgi:Uma2 family endonuclease
MARGNYHGEKIMATAEVMAPASSVPEAVARRPVVINGTTRIPSEVVDLDSFYRWACSEQFPERGRFSFLGGEIWADLSMEELYTHNLVKTAFVIGVGGFVEAQDLGLYVGDGMLLSNLGAALSTEPDGMFVSYAALESGRAARVKGRLPGIFKLEDTPEMVLEVVSATSVDKDTEVLRELYWLSGIPEYWLIDAREKKVRFELLKHGSQGYTGTRRQAGGWLKSSVFGKDVRLTQRTDRLGDPRFTVELRD